MSRHHNIRKLSNTILSSISLLIIIVQLSLLLPKALLFCHSKQQQHVNSLNNLVSTSSAASTDCQMTIETYKQLTSSHDYKFLPNVYGTWRLIGSLTSMQISTTSPNTLVDCPKSIQVTMITVTANILRQTLFGLSINILNNNTYYESNLWAMAYQPKMSPLYFEMFTDIHFNDTATTGHQGGGGGSSDGGGSGGPRERIITLIEQELVINSSRTIHESEGLKVVDPQMKNPSTDYVYIKPVRIRKAFFGTEFIIEAKLEDLLKSSLEYSHHHHQRTTTTTEAEATVSVVPSLSELLISNLNTKFEFKLFASKFSNSKLQFPLPSSVLFGESNVLFQDSVSLNAPLEDPSLVMQKRAVSANYVLSTLIVIVNGITALITFFFLIYFRKTEPRSSRGYLPYVVILQVLVNFCRVLLQSFWGEEYLLVLFTFISFGLLNFTYLVYFMNTLFFFYKRKVYSEMYNKLKRESLDKKNQQLGGSGSNLSIELSEQQQQQLASSSTNHLALPPSNNTNNGNNNNNNDDRSSSSKNGSGSSLNNDEKQLTFRWARSKPVKIFTTVFMITLLVIIYSIIIPLLFTVPATGVVIALQALSAAIVAFAVILVIIAFGIDMIANKKLIFECKFSNYFIRNDRLYYRLEMLIHIVSIVFFVSMGIFRSAAMLRTDDMIGLLSNTYAPSVILAFVSLPLELFAIFFELMGSGGGFICIMTLYERIRLSNQCSEGIGFLFERYQESDNGSSGLGEQTTIELDEGEIIKFRTIRNSPYLDLLGDELARLFIDERGFELIRQFSKTEFSMENLGFISEMEKVYTQLFVAVRQQRGSTNNTPIGKSPSSDYRPTTTISSYRPQFKQNLTMDEISNATNELKFNIYNKYVPDSAPMTVNLSSYSKNIFNKWSNTAKNCFVDDSYVKSESFVNDLDYVVMDVVKNLKDTFRRLQLTSDYKKWLEIVKKNSLSLKAIKKAKSLTGAARSNTNMMTVVTTTPTQASTTNTPAASAVTPLNFIEQVNEISKQQEGLIVLVDDNHGGGAGVAAEQIPIDQNYNATNQQHHNNTTAADDHATNMEYI